MNEHELLDRIALAYIQQKKKPEDAYKIAVQTILQHSIKAHRELETQIKKMRNRGDI